MKKSYDYFKKYLSILNGKGLYPAIYTVDGPSHYPVVKIKGKEYLSFCSNNYMGLAGNDKVKKAVKDSLDLYGVGSGSTRLLSGTLDIQIEFEKQLANFFGYEDAITFSSGYLANVGVIRMFVDSFPYFKMFFEKDGLIISDQLNHASIIDGVRLAKSNKEVYPHNDMVALEKILKKNKNKRKLIVTDGIFSMDGDFANLGEITTLADKYDALVMVDDSHGVGVLGEHGEGLLKELGVTDKVDILMGSFTKAFGSIGGFVAVNKILGDYLRVTARSYIFSDPIPPSLVAGLMEQTKLIKQGDKLRQNLKECADLLRNGLKAMGFTVYGTSTSIVPLIIGDEMKAIKFAEGLFNSGILAPCIRKPAVENGKERIRFSIMATHQVKDINKLLSVCKDIGKSLKIIK